MKDIERIDSYLRNELTNDEKVQFERRLKTDLNLLSIYKEHKALQDSLRYSELSEKIKLLNSFEEQRESDGSSTSKIFRKNIFLNLAYILGMIALCSLSYWGFKSMNKSSSEPPSRFAHIFNEENFDNFIFHKISRSTNGSELSVEQVFAYNQFTIQNFEKAIPELEKLWKIQSDTLAFYYLGISYLGTDQSEKAKDILNSSIVQKYENPIK